MLSALLSSGSAHNSVVIFFIVENNISREGLCQWSAAGVITWGRRGTGGGGGGIWDFFWGRISTCAPVPSEMG